MAFIHRRRPWQIRGLKETAQADFEAWSQIDRRTMLQSLVAGGAAVAMDAVVGLGASAMVAQDKKGEAGSEYFPAKRNESFKLDRPITDELAAARYNNFYEFSESKRVAPLVKLWDISGWKLEVSGLVEKPTTFDMDDLARKFPYEERLYRFRCVETWAMAVPWTGFALRKLLEYVEPQASANFVKFVSFDHKKAKGTRRGRPGEPWPYTEAVTIDEARNDLAFIVTGIYGHALPKQHGAPVRVALPWKYGFKGAKSIVRIELVAARPATFWPILVPSEYDFIANVDPTVPHPRWSQATEWDIGTKVRRPTLPFNGYGELVASLYYR
jgi:sulfoxide reductase catalytic subunit YedY